MAAGYVSTPLDSPPSSVDDVSDFHAADVAGEDGREAAKHAAHEALAHAHVRGEWFDVTDYAVASGSPVASAIRPYPSRASSASTSRAAPRSLSHPTSPESPPPSWGAILAAPVRTEG